VAGPGYLPFRPEPRPLVNPESISLIFVIVSIILAGLILRYLVIKK
jgi:hypothetical protein